ncbi:MAG: ATP-binding cassette domain-containing protein [Eubacteriales bacterium]|nr:ATP-binding cassette domain-containing protein [Eubacteriales bacterium]
MSDLVVRKLNKSFGKKVVLKDFSGVFPEGKGSSIMGSSGCGKTTLLHILMGIEKADSGEITGMPRKISAVFQEDRLFDSFSALSNIRAVTGKEVPEERIREHLNALGITETENKPVSQFSGGMRRRVAIVRAVLCDADLILMDEPLKGLDQETKEVVMDYIKKQTRGKTTIIVTHDEEEAEALGEHKIRMTEVNRRDSDESQNSE